MVFEQQREDRPFVVEVDAVMQGKIRGAAVQRAGIEIEVSEALGASRSLPQPVFPLATGPSIATCRFAMPGERIGYRRRKISFGPGP